MSRPLLLALLAVAALACGKGDRREPEGGPDGAIDETPSGGGPGDAGGGAAIADAGVAPMDAAALACATAPADALTGSARVRNEGSGGYTETSASVTWTLVERIGCLDRFAPSGTAHHDFAGGMCSPLVFEPDSAPVAAGDGVLTIDRTASPASYAASGETRWNAVARCTLPSGEVESTDTMLGGEWLTAVTGKIEGGAATGATSAGPIVEWQFTIVE